MSWHTWWVHQNGDCSSHSLHIYLCYPCLLLWMKPKIFKANNFMVYITSEWEREIKISSQKWCKALNSIHFLFALLAVPMFIFIVSFELFIPKIYEHSNLHLSHREVLEIKDFCIVNAFTFVQQWPHINYVLCLIFWYFLLLR